MLDNNCSFEFLEHNYFVDNFDYFADFYYFVPYFFDLYHKNLMNYIRYYYYYYYYFDHS